MKPSTPVILSLFALLGSSSPLNAADPPAEKLRGKKSEMRDVATHDQLVAKLRQVTQKNPIENLGPPIGNREVDPSKKNADRDLIKSSAIFCYQGNLTLVPKQAVLHVPEKLKDRMGPRPGVKVLTWRDFYSRNRGWIRTIEVTRAQALGHVAIPESMQNAISETSSLVVATFKEGPISVLPLKAPEDVSTPLESKPVTYRK